ncbi:hypothetical protein I307_01432 [Cryptococcus deuterogattii 99/473]|uniref:Isochorismatase-like domain-containing protein n=1 Tax=Cryptococcus deuterogattii Ram5 TaxID=1296110 RepID=A0A0D0UWF1_9TREE|nr:hypothetical protein I309_01592 [Cryptococcus deuterogattii LA55]KIR39551.1 hypothetical protein I313_04576 [Cryptococcus deuterogattii Ram5]KIR73886.1 hypothetical protein I310_02563 [Cryptococcus deuterogattii CA1014]KIR93378.1 hypothetical protein I304_03046 [Cryptococcus deuterogattii CBS 10090]KIR99359.1 hypothetical protein L804_02985 [Cryptococcus deuterogattii 2001/935-1]KIY59181.1 hypothetical protein I307_01432 [Cryptococcus deuterogattii 99/473]
MAINPRKTLMLICDVQERFRSAIHGFDAMTSSICKLIKATQVLEVPTFVTEQNPKALGSTVGEITSLLDRKDLNQGVVSKTKFSMMTEDTIDAIDFSKYNHFILTGIESHICVLQTALDLLQYRTKPKVYLAVDAVSSCNKEEVPIALRYLQQQGVEVTSSESLIYRLLVAAWAPETLQPDAGPLWRTLSSQRGFYTKKKCKKYLSARESNSGLNRTKS